MMNVTAKVTYIILNTDTSPLTEFTPLTKKMKVNIHIQIKVNMGSIEFNHKLRGHIIIHRPIAENR